MSELRRNPITGHWVIMAENRGQRPQEVVLQQSVQDRFECPFCEGREERTPGETLAHCAPGASQMAPAGAVRVVPNLYPAVDPRGTKPAAESELFLPAIGLHEVIIESPRHLHSVTQLDDTQFAEVLDVYRERLGHVAPRGCFPGCFAI